MDAEENEDFVIVVREVTGMTFNFTMLGLRSGTYRVQVRYPTFCYMQWVQFRVFLAFCMHALYTIMLCMANTVNKG